MYVLSIANIHGLNFDQIVDLGNIVRTQRGENELIGWATILRTDIIRINRLLDISYDNGPEWHAEIIGWPGDPTMRLRIQKDLAKAVKENNRGVLLPTPPGENKA